MIELPVTPADMEIVTAAANGRQAFAERNKYVPYDKSARIQPEQQRTNDIAGCLGELKCAHYFGLKFDPSVGVITNVDLKIIEVRTRRIETGRDLAIRPKDKMRLPYVLVWLDFKRMIAMMVGWLCGWQAHERAMQAKQEAGHDVWWQQIKQVWFIPPPYHSIASLEDWIGAGAPQHWAPEQYR